MAALPLVTSPLEGEAASASAGSEGKPTQSRCHLTHRSATPPPQGEREATAAAARRNAAQHRAARNQGDPLGAGRRREPHHRHDREPARLGDLAPARLGRADRGVRARERGDGSATILQDDGGQQAHRRRLRAGGRRRLVQGRRARALPRLARQRGLEEGRRHLRRLVRLRLDARLRAGGPEAFPEPRRHQAQARRRPGHGDVSRRLRPAPRLVPLLAAGKLRHARPRAVRRGADPRLRARRAGPQDVEVARQRQPRRRT